MLAGWDLQMLLAAVFLAGIVVMPSAFDAPALGIAAATLTALLAIGLKLGTLALRALKFFNQRICH